MARVPTDERRPKAHAKAVRAFKEVEPVLLPLLELFAVVDGVMEEANAFSGDHIKQSLGRIYRQWLNTRESLDPEFDRERYRQDMKAAYRSRASVLKTQTPFAAKRRAKDSRKPSTAHQSISEKKPRPTAKNAKPSASRSAKVARSNGRASIGR